VKVYMNEAKRVRLKDGGDFTAFKLIVITSTPLTLSFFETRFVVKLNS